MTLQFNLAAKREFPKLKTHTTQINALLAQLGKAPPPEPYKPIVWSKTPLYRALGKKITDPVVRKQLRNIIGHYLKTHACVVRVDKNNLNSALTWNDTPHGHAFWKEAHNKWFNNGAAW